jgi:hypothetical protein
MGSLEVANNVAAGLPIILSEVRHDYFQFLQTNDGQLTPQSILRSFAPPINTFPSFTGPEFSMPFP